MIRTGRHSNRHWTRSNTVTHVEQEVGINVVFLLVLLQQVIQLGDGQAVEVEVVVLVVELVVVEGVDGAGMLSDDEEGVLLAVERLHSHSQLLDVAVGCVVVQSAVFLQRLCKYNKVR